MVYYNEFDPEMAAWLRELIEEGLIPRGEVDDRSIADVKPGDLRGFVQCHFFAGIGGWPFALHLAGWPEDRPVWTGSCPCQPFSSAGKGLGTEDPRHLWPVFRELIRECRPSTAFGEQVASKLGRDWLAGVFDDLEGMGYAVAGADLCAAGVNAPHIRQRLFWMAYAYGKERDRGLGESEPARGRGPANRSGLGDPDHPGSQGFHWNGNHRNEPGWINPDPAGSTRAASGLNPWGDFRLILCRDGKHRRIAAESGLFPLAHGVSFKVGRRRSARAALLKGAGNAIVPQVAARFITSAREAIKSLSL